MISVEFYLCGCFSFQLAEAAKAQFSRDFSDHLALVRAYDGWKSAEKEYGGYDYCWKNFLSIQSMKAIDSLRREFYTLLKDTGLVDDKPSSFNGWSHGDKLVRAVICYGLYPGICSVLVSCSSFHGNQYLCRLLGMISILFQQVILYQCILAY